jgi:hypothetical protein
VGAIIKSRVLRWGLYAALFIAGAYYSVIWFDTCTYKYRLTIAVQTPDGVKSGSSVIERTRSFSNFVIGDSSGVAHTTLRGEAVYVDLGQNRNLFVLLGDAASGRRGTPGDMNGALDAGDMPLVVMNIGFNPRLIGWQERWAAKRARERGPVDVPFISLPTVVTFPNIADPLSVTLVDPRDLAATFGEGFALQSAKIEITNDPITVQISAVLPWLASFEGKSGGLDGADSGPDDAVVAQLGYAGFKQ